MSGAGFVWPEGLVHVQVGPHEIPVRPVVRTVMVGVRVGGGCVNDTAEDRWLWEAEYHGRVAVGTTPEAAARAVLIS